MEELTSLYQEIERLKEAQVKMLLAFKAMRQAIDKLDKVLKGEEN